MTRYHHGYILMCMLVNTIFYVPQVLIKYRFEGTISSMAVSIVSGTLCAVIFTKAMTKFSGLGLPEIFKGVLPSWIRVPYLLFLAGMWFISGGIVITAYARLVQRFISPEFNLFILLLFLIAVCAYIASGDSYSVLYFLEVIIILCLPLMAFITYKTLSSDYMNWDAIRVITQYHLKAPKIEALSAASYIFSGYLNMAIFNRCFDKNTRIRGLWLIPVIGALVLSTTYFIPIGIHGTYGVQSYVYVWINTADAIRMEFGFIEHMVYIFLLLYLGVSILFTCVTWHVGAELLKGIFAGKSVAANLRSHPWFTFGILAVNTVLILISARLFTEKQFSIFSKLWFILRYPAEIMLVMVVAFLAWRKKA